MHGFRSKNVLRGYVDLPCTLFRDCEAHWRSTLSCCLFQSLNFLSEFCTSLHFLSWFCTGGSTTPNVVVKCGTTNLTQLGSEKQPLGCRVLGIRLGHDVCFWRSGDQLGCTVAAVSDQRPVEHFKISRLTGCHTVYATTTEEQDRNALFHPFCVVLQIPWLLVGA